MTRTALRTTAGAVVLLHGMLSGCGGSGGDGASAPVAVTPPATPAPATATTIDYPRSVVLGVSTAQDVVYASAAGAVPASVTVATSSVLLRAGTNPVIAEHVESTLAGLRVVCASGDGRTTNVVTGINPGVLAKSAAVLLDAGWTATDATAAWTAATLRGGTWTGWENCGVKPEGAPSPSSRLTPQADRGYGEDVYDGNPGTTYNVISRRVSATTVAEMLSAAGSLTTDDKTRPLRLTLRAWRDNAGNTIFIETGDPVPGAPATAQGFVAPYFWSSQ